MCCLYISHAFRNPSEKEKRMKEKTKATIKVIVVQTQINYSSGIIRDCQQMLVRKINLWKAGIVAQWTKCQLCWNPVSG